MSVAKQVTIRQDKDGMLRRALERIIQLYTDKSHFVYELLQNAEDAGATNIKFNQYVDRLEVIHNGRPFTLGNLQGLCDIGKSDKINNLNQIGEFGVGFKSVFGICETVKLYSSPFDEHLTSECQPFAIEILDFTRPEDIEYSTVDFGYTTKFVFPYSIGHSFSGFKSIHTLNDVLSKRLQNLGITTLLFMKNLQSIEYSVNLPTLKTKGIYILEKNQLTDNCKLVSAIGQTGKKTEENISYLVFSKPILGIQSGRTIDIAFAVNVDENGNYTFRKTEFPYISVYFPTEKESKLNFIVQGPYRTTPNRGSVPDDDTENKELAKQTAQLLCESVLQLKELGQVNYSLLNILPFDDNVFANSPLFLDMYHTTIKMLKEQALIPCRNGNLANRENVILARNAELPEVFTDSLITELFNDGKEYHWLPTFLTENSRTYKGLHSFLKAKLEIKELRPENFKPFFENNPEFLPNRSNDWLVKLYSMYESVEAAFSKHTDRGKMLMAPFIKTDKGTFVTPYRKAEVFSEKFNIAVGSGTYMPNVFLPIGNIEDNEDINFVEPDVFKRCKKFFIDILGLQKPNEYELFRKSFLKRYGQGKGINDKQHLSDFRNLLKFKYFDEYRDDVKTLIKDHFLLKCTKGDIELYLNPSKSTIYFKKTDDGLDIEQYYKNLFKEEPIYVDEDFYGDRNALKEFGIINHIATGMNVSFGRDYIEEFRRERSWKAVGEFKFKLSLDNLEYVLTRINNFPTEESSYAKSYFIFKFLKNNEKYLAGHLDIHGHGYYLPERAEIIKVLTKFSRNLYGRGKWLYTESFDLVSPDEISKHELNHAIYGDVDNNSIIYDLLGFKKDKADRIKAAQKSYDLLSDEDKDNYLEIALQRKYGLSIADLDNVFVKGVSGDIKPDYGHHNYDESFPSAKIKNWDGLRKHVAAVYSYAKPVLYQLLVRSVRVSKSANDVKSYLKSMYKSSDSYRFACQMCHNMMSNLETTQIDVNPDLELEQMNLYLCPNCATKYRKMRNNIDALNDFLTSIVDLEKNDIEKSDPVKVDFLGESIWFTQTHVAEIREILLLQEDINNPDMVVEEEQNDDVINSIIGVKVYYTKNASFATIQDVSNGSVRLRFKDGQEKVFSLKTVLDKNIIQVVKPDDAMKLEMLK